MRRVFQGSAIMASLVLLGLSAHAGDKGQGQGLGAALKSAGRAGAPKGQGEMGRAMSKMGGSAARAGQGLGRSNKALQGVGKGTNGLDHQRNNAQRNLDHRLDQADHLRANAERNGNENLSRNADRMEAQAQGQFDSRTERIDNREKRFDSRVVGTANESPAENTTSDVENVPGKTSQPAKSVKSARKSWWPFSQQ